MVRAPHIDRVTVRQRGDWFSVAALDERVIGLPFAPIESHLQWLEVVLGRVVVGFHTNGVKAAGVSTGHRAIENVLEENGTHAGTDVIDGFIMNDVPGLAGIGEGPGALP